jgi:hypothetical protein
VPHRRSKEGAKAGSQHGRCMFAVAGRTPWTTGDACMQYVVCFPHYLESCHQPGVLRRDVALAQAQHGHHLCSNLGGHVEPQLLPAMRDCCICQACQQRVWILAERLERHRAAVVVCLQLQPLTAGVELHPQRHKPWPGCLL